MSAPSRVEHACQSCPVWQAQQFLCQSKRCRLAQSLHRTSLASTLACILLESLGRSPASRPRFPTEVGLSTQPPPSPETRRGRNIAVLSIYALFVGWRGNVLSVILQPFVLALGGTVAFLGLLESLGSYRGLIPTVIQPLGGWIADRIGRKEVVIAAGLVTAASLLLLALAGQAASLPLLLPAVALLGLSGIGRPATDALVGESAGARVGYAYGQVTFAWALSGVIALAAGFLANRLGFPLVFAIAAAVDALGVVLVAFWVTETLSMRRAARLQAHEFRPLVTTLLRPAPELRVFYLAVVIDAFAYGVGSALLYGFLTARFGFTPFHFGIMTTVYSLSWAAAQLPAGRWADHGRGREMLILSEMVSATAILTWLLTTSFVAFAASMVPLGVASALWFPALMSWVYTRVPQARRAEELGRLSAIPGLLSFPAPFVGGLLFERLGFAAPLALNLAGALLAAAIIAWRLTPQHQGR